MRGSIFSFLLIDHGSNSGPYKVLNFDSDAVRDLGVSSLFGPRLPSPLLKEIGTTGRSFDGPWCTF